MNNLVTVANVTTIILSYQGMRVVTTKQLAEFYECDPIKIQQNFNNNKERFEEGKHYIKITGAQVTDFVRYSKISNTEIPEATTVLMLWTEKGAARHAKMLTTEKAWSVFEELEDCYFRVKQSAVLLPDFTNPALAARAWADQVEARLLAETGKAKVDEQLALAEPKVAAFNLISASKDNLTITEAAKVLSKKRSDLTVFMQVNGWIYRQNGSWVAYDKHLKNGTLAYKEAKYTDDKTGLECIKPYCHITPKGLVKLALMLGIKPSANDDQMDIFA